MVQSGKGNDFVKDFIEIGLLPWVAEMATSSSEFVSRYAFQLLAAVFTFLEHDIRDVRAYDSAPSPSTPRTWNRSSWSNAHFNCGRSTW